MKRSILFAALAVLTWSAAAHASIGWGTLSNFDTVNDTGVPAHGFEIEIDDAYARDVMYTYDWNHYGTPKISEDLSDPVHPIAKVTWSSKKKPDGSWASYTAVPTSPITPTNGHMFTNPSVNFGGEHFGVCFYGNATAVRYYWLVDDGAGNLQHGGMVDIGTPTFFYYPPVLDAAGQVVQVAQANAVIPEPVPVEPPVYEFGDATWVRITRTKAHNRNKVELRDLASEDPNDSNRKNWKNGEQDEVEIRWRILQVDNAAADGGVDAEVANAPEDLPDGDEVVTLRYDFFKYVGPYDNESHKAGARDVAPDDLHGVDIRKFNRVKMDFSQIVVVGDYIGAQMAGFDPAQQLGLIDHLQDGEAGVPYIERSMVVGGTPPVLNALEGELPAGMRFDEITGILSGTPESAGLYTFTINSTDATEVVLSTEYNLTIAEAGELIPAHFTVQTSAALAEGGSVTGDGEYKMDEAVTVVATANAGYAFVNWTEAGAEVSTSPSYESAAKMNRNLVANFIVTPVVYTIEAVAGLGGSVSGAGPANSGTKVTLVATPSAGYSFANWTENGQVVGVSPSLTLVADANHSVVANFVRITYVVATSAAPIVGGSVSGGGTVNSGSQVTVLATPNVGYNFLNWTENGAVVSTLSTYSFAAAGNRSLVANFALATANVTISLSASPSTSGSVAGGGVVNTGTSVTVTATPKAGFTFKNWTEGGTVVSTTASYTFVANASRNLVANFNASAPVSITVKQIKASSTVNSGTVNTFSVSLASAAPAGGVVVALSSSLPGALSVPATVIVAAGKTDANFTATAGALKGNVTLSAQVAASKVSTTVRVK